MPGKFSRIKVWVKEKLKYNDLNGEFNNIINNMTPTGLDGQSTTLGNMQTDVNPAPYGPPPIPVQVPVLATNLAGEIFGLRFALRRFFGTAFWYSDPGRTLLAHSEDLLSYLGFFGNNQNDAYADMINHGVLLNPTGTNIANVLATDLSTSLKRFGAGDCSFTSGNVTLMTLPNKLNVPQGSVSAHFYGINPSDYIAYNPLMGLELYLDAAGLLSLRLTKATATVEGAKDLVINAGVVSRSGIAAFHHVGFKFQLNNLGGVGTDSLNLQYDNAVEGATVGANLLANIGSGGNWFFGCRRNNPGTPLLPAWDKFSSFSPGATPSAEVGDPWALAAGPGGTVTNGVLTIPVTTTLYQKTNHIDLTHFTMETKVKLSASNIGGLGGTNATVAWVNDNVLARTFSLVMELGRLELHDPGASTLLASVPLDTSQYNVIRVTSFGGPNPFVTVYINGVAAMTGVLTGAGGGFPFIIFGHNNQCISDWEYYAYHSAGFAVYPPIVPNAAVGQLDDIAIIKGLVADAVLVALANNPAKLVYGIDPADGPYMPPENTFITTVTGQSPLTTVFVGSDGKRPTNYSFSGSVTVGGDAVGVATPLVTPISPFKMTPLQEYTSTGRAALVGKRVLPLGLQGISVYARDSTNVAVSSAQGSLTVYRGDK